MRSSSDLVGNDGQFNYYIALGPGDARPYIDQDSYRYTRILYPILARLAAFGQPALVPSALLLINLAAVGGGALALAGWLERRGLSPWLALAYGLAPGIFLCLYFDFAEPVAFGLVMLGVVALDVGPRPRWAWASAAFALAALTRETTIVFPAVLATCAMAADSGRRVELPAGLRSRGGPFLLLAATPVLLWKALLVAWTGHVGGGLGLEKVPFLGILSYPLFPPGIIWTQLLIVVVPALAAACVAIVAAARLGLRAEQALVVTNVILFVVLLERLSYAGLTASLRILLAVVVAALLCLPSVVRLGPRWHPAMRITGVLWLAATPVVLLRVLGVLPGL